MISFEATEAIRRAAGDVWAYAADVAEHPRWMSVTDPRLISGSATEVGGRGWEVLHLGPFRFGVEFEVISAVPDRRIGWRAVSGLPFGFELHLELEPLDAVTTRARYFGTITLRGAWRLLRPLLAAEAKAGPARELARLKHVLESSATTRGGLDFGGTPRFDTAHEDR